LAGKTWAGEDRDSVVTAGLPDLCSPGSLFLLVLVGLVVALVFALAASAGLPGFWLEFGLSVLFVQWVVLVSAGLLCALRRHEGRLGSAGVAWLVFLLIPAVTLVMSLFVVAWLPGQPPAGPGWFAARNTLISLLASLLLLRYLALQQRWRAQVAAETRARLDALQARIRPHFLFNALNTIASLVHTNPDAAEAATLDLSDLLRIGLRPGATHSLAEELELVRGYVRIEKLRLGRRLQVEWDLPDNLPQDHQLPVLIIQPLVENAVVHGIARRAQGGRLTISLRMEKRSRLRLEITNPLADDSSKPGEGNRMALGNIRQRLELAYEDGARLRAGAQRDCFRVVLTLPVPSGKADGQG